MSQRHEIVSRDGTHLDAAVRVAEAPRAVALLVHGITVDKDEGGMYVRLAEGLADVGIVSARFSFRGHGASGGRSQDMTIAGEVEDLYAAVDWIVRQFDLPLFVVAGSFGAVPTLLADPSRVVERLAGLVLWNPVLDLRATFLRPDLPWGRENFNPSALAKLLRQGHLDVDGTFRLGRELFEEFATLDPRSSFVGGTVPSLVIHGDRDSYVSYSIAADACSERANCEFHSVRGSDHGFDNVEREAEAIGVTIDWISARAAVGADAR